MSGFKSFVDESDVAPKPAITADPNLRKTSFKEFMAILMPYFWPSVGAQQHLSLREGMVCGVFVVLQGVRPKIRAISCFGVLIVSKIANIVAPLSK